MGPSSPSFSYAPGMVFRLEAARSAPLTHPFGFRTSLCIVALVAQIGCAGKQKEPPLPPTENESTEDAEPIPSNERAEPALPWAKATFSPQPGSTPEPFLEKAEAACGVGDAALHEAAREVASLHGEFDAAESLDIAKFHLRRLGSPYVMPRMWAATVAGVDEEQIAKSVREWATTRPPLGEYRCGLGLSEAKDGSRTITVLQVDVLVEVKPVPTQVDAGTWIDFSATLLVPTSTATVLLLPPEGLPRHLTTKIESGTATARFSIETKGTWLLQLMATQSGGPRPVAQMLVSADRPPPASLDARPVPGEDAFDKSAEPGDALFALLNAARKDQGLPVVRRNRTLDEAARVHTEAMLDKGRISHDTGNGNPAFRVELAGLKPKATGENVAMAGTVVRLHRVLWASPAHRENLLLRRWDEAGVWVAAREDGTLFTTQLFIDQD